MNYRRWTVDGGRFLSVSWGFMLSLIVLNVPHLGGETPRQRYARSESCRPILTSPWAKRKLFAVVQVLTSCVTFLLLTATVMPRPDEDGYQGIHLFFMPRLNWEMDEGRGMLHEEEYYREIDEHEMLEEVYGRDVDSLEEYDDEEPSVDTASERDYERGGYHSDKLMLRGTPHRQSFSSNEMPAVKPFDASLTGAHLVAMSREPSIYMMGWQPDVPSPPPRITRSLPATGPYSGFGSRALPDRQAGSALLM